MAGEGLVAQGMAGFSGAGLQQRQVRLGKAEPAGNKSQGRLLGQLHTIKLAFFERQNRRCAQADGAQGVGFAAVFFAQAGLGESALAGMVLPLPLLGVHAQHEVVAAQRAKSSVAVIRWPTGAAAGL